MTDTFSRRAFVARLGAAALALSATGRLARQAIAQALPISSTTPVDLSLLATPAQIRKHVGQMVALGPRLTGSAAHKRWIDTLERGFRSAGLSVTRDRYTFPKWETQRWGLDLLEGEGRGSVPVSSYVPYSGGTPPAGIEAPLAYVGPVPLPTVPGDPTQVAGDRAGLDQWQSQVAAGFTSAMANVPGGIAGRIALVDIAIPPLQAGDFEGLVTYTYDPDMTIQATSDYRRVWLAGYVTGVLSAAKAAGAAGLVMALDAQPANAAGQYLPYHQAVFGIPALYVNRDTGRRLRGLAASHPKTRLTLVAKETPKATTDSLVAVLPGDGSTDEVMLMSTHTDGQNAFEENGGVALLEIARYFSALRSCHPDRRLKRTLVFSAFSGHFGPTLPQAQGFVDRHPDLVKRAAACLTVEHFGATEWLDDARGYYPTGYNELASIWHSQTAIAAILVETMRDNDLRRTSALRPAGDYMLAVGGPYHKAGIPTLSYIAGPNYLLAVDPDPKHGHIDKLDPDRYHRELVWCVDTLQRWDATSKAALAAGDTAVLGSDGGADSGDGPGPQPASPPSADGGTLAGGATPAACTLPPYPSPAGTAKKPAAHKHKRHRHHRRHRRHRDARFTG